DIFYLKHRIIISCLIWNLLNYIPVFNNLPILYTKNIHYSNSLILRISTRMYMKSNCISFSYYTFNLCKGIWIFYKVLLKEIHEGFSSISNKRIMLLIIFTYIFRDNIDIMFVKNFIIEINYHLFSVKRLELTSQTS